MRIAGTTPDAVTEATNVLTKQKYIAKGEGGTWILARDLENVTLADLHAAFQLTLEPSDLLNLEGLDWGQRLAERVDALNLSGSEVMSISLKALLSPAEGTEIIDFPDRTEEVEILDRKSKWLAILGLTWFGGS